MPMLEAPLEWMGLLDGQQVSFHIERWTKGEAVIYQTSTRQQKIIPVLRLYVRPSDKVIGAPYWDVSATTSVARLNPYLDRPDLRDLEFTFVRHGTPPAARDEIRIKGPGLA